MQFNQLFLKWKYRFEFLKPKHFRCLPAIAWLKCQWEARLRVCADRLPALISVHPHFFTNWSRNRGQVFLFRIYSSLPSGSGFRPEPWAHHLWLFQSPLWCFRWSCPCRMSSPASAAPHVASCSCRCSSLLGIEGSALQYFVFGLCTFYVLFSIVLPAPHMAPGHYSCVEVSSAFRRFRIQSSRWTYLQETVDLLILSVAFVWPFITA